MDSKKLNTVEDYPEINLDLEDKIRIIKGLFLIIIFSSVCNI